MQSSARHLPFQTPRHGAVAATAAAATAEWGMQMQLGRPVQDEFSRQPFSLVVVVSKWSAAETGSKNPVGPNRYMKAETCGTGQLHFAGVPKHPLNLPAREGLPWFPQNLPCIS